MQSKSVLFCCLFPLALSLCAAGPPPEGVETRFQAGTGTFEYTSGGCGGPQYANRAVEGSAFASASYRHRTGLGGAADVSAAVVKNTSSRLIDPGDDPDPPASDPNELNKTRFAASFAPRLGYHHAYFGIEAGVFVLADVGDPIILPSGTVWAGVPRYAFVWGSFLEGPMSFGHLPVEAGIGHSSEHVRGKIGVGYEPSLLIEGSINVTNDLPLFLGARFTQLLAEDHRGILGGLTLAYTW